MHALVIEDQALFAMLLEDELRELGYSSFDIVATEADAINSAANNRPDLITADQRLAAGSGVDAIRAICTEHHIPFVFVTSYQDEVRSIFLTRRWSASHSGHQRCTRPSSRRSG